MPFDDLIDSVVRRPSSSWAGAYAAASGLGLATVIAGILAWLGIEFTPDAQPDAPDSGPQSALMFGHSH